MWSADCLHRAAGLAKTKTKGAVVICRWTVALLISFSFALALGGQSIEQRVDTLFEDDPMTVYYSKPGRADRIRFTTLLSQYPVGAGLGPLGHDARLFWR